MSLSPTTATPNMRCSELAPCFHLDLPVSASGGWTKRVGTCDNR